MSPKERTKRISLAVVAVLGLLLVFRLFTLSSQISELNEKVASLTGQLASTTRLFRNDIDTLNASFNENLTTAQHNNILLEQRLKKEVGTVAGTVTTLEKLSKTDPQLLAKYSKVFFLNENYAPERLIEIPSEYKWNPDKAVSIHALVWPLLKNLMDEARKNSTSIYISSGYRSFAEQKNLKSDYRVTYGAGTANQFSADQGYSEHQLGTAVDFTTQSLRGALDGFDATGTSEWLLANAHRFGFVLSYAKNNEYYVYEPWHWRYVGVKLATDLKKQGKGFYDLDQREIDKYLVSVFE